MAEVTTHVFLDRIEGDYGVIVTGDGRSLDVPLAWLPAGVREGVALTISVAVDEQATSEGRAKVASLMDELIKRSGT